MHRPGPGFRIPARDLFGADISSAALAVASRNAARLGMPERVKFLESDLLKAAAGVRRCRNI